MPYDLPDGFMICYLGNWRGYAVTYRGSSCGWRATYQDALRLAEATQERLSRSRRKAVA